MKFFILLFFTLIPNIIFANNSCNLSGKQTLMAEQHDINVKFKKINEKINHNVFSHIVHYKKKHCPVGCKQENKFKISVSKVPKFVEKNSCKGTNEQYRFKKQFKVRTTNNKLKDMDYSTQLLNSWIKKTFMNPYMPLRKKNVSSEHKNTLESACPPCSFYVYYDYVFTKDNVIDTNVLVKCGDRKIIRFLRSNFKTKTTLTNHWKCSN